MKTIEIKELQSTNNVSRALQAGKLMSQEETKSLFQATWLLFYQAQRGDAVRGKDSWINTDSPLYKTGALPPSSEDQDFNQENI